MTAPFTMDQYTALCAAYAGGELRVKYADKEVWYRSLSEMLQIKRSMESALGITPPNQGQRVLMSYSKGLNGTSGGGCR